MTNDKAREHLEWLDDQVNQQLAACDVGQRVVWKRHIEAVRVALDALADSDRLDFLDSCDPRALTSIFGMVGDGNDVRGQIDREMAVAKAVARE